MVQSLYTSHIIIALSIAKIYAKTSYVIALSPFISQHDTLIGNQFDTKPK